MYRRFQRDIFGWGMAWQEGAMRGELSMDKFVMGEENFHEGDT